MVFLVQMIMAIAPYGVCTLMAYSVSKVGLSVMAALAVYALTVIGGLLLHLILVVTLMDVLIYLHVILILLLFMMTVVVFIQN